MAISEQDARGQILLGAIADKAADMYLEGYDIKDILESLPGAIETIVNGRIEAEQEIQHKRGE